MRYKVIQTFATPGHRFHAGTEVDGNDIDGQITPERWVELGKIEAIENVSWVAPMPPPELEHHLEDGPQP